MLPGCARTDKGVIMVYGLKEESYCPIFSSAMSGDGDMLLYSGEPNMPTFAP